MAKGEPVIVDETREEFDVLVVGSGVSGGWAAKEFCEKGFRTLVIERGRLVRHRQDYPMEGVPPWKQEFGGKVPLDVAARDHAVQSQCYAFRASTRGYFGNDRELPYATAEGTTFSWIRANQLGGKSLLWARQSYRLSDHDFEANARDGEGIDWPIRYADLAPWYDHVERFAGISGSREGLPQLPDGEFQPPFEMNRPEQAVKQAVESAFPDRKVIIGRTANLTKPTELQVQLGRVVCQARSECENGCSFGANFSTQSATLPAAARTGNLHIAPNSVVHSLIHDPASNRVRGVRVIDNETLATREYFGRVVFLCASTLGSTQVLLNSASKRFPNGLGNGSGVLGRYLMDHNYNSVSRGDIPGFEDEYYKGRRPTGVYVPNFQYEPSRYRAHYKRGYALGGSAQRGGWQWGGYRDGFGAEFKAGLGRPGPWNWVFYAQGEMLPKRENRVDLHPTLTDKWGIPQLNIDIRWGENELLMMEDAAEASEAMMRAAGIENLRSDVTQKPPGLAIHEVGTARMGRDPKTSVFNGNNQAHEVPNLFCTDGSVFCSTATQNPSLTFMALTARAADFAAREMANRRL